jgi:hypothetical protein
VDRHARIRVVEDHARLDANALRELDRRLDGYGRSPDLGADWNRGVPRGWLDTLLEDWRGFDTRAFQLRLDALHPRNVPRSQAGYCT